MEGTVTVSIKNFKKLEKEAEIGVKATIAAKSMDLEITRLLSFLSIHMDMKAVAKSYNNIDGAAKMEVIGENCKLVWKKE